ncbi:MAG: hypothetical protein LUQ65_13335 [Candidatus Helarchaeota archaeon]|nr:hypothetical protein [Candidatus Helarchaeota archaeon]
MSREFASFMASISGESAEQRLKELSEILDKVMQIVINSIDQLSGNLAQIETRIQNITSRIVRLETMPTMAAPMGFPGGAPGGAPGVPPPMPAMAPPPPPLEPKPANPMSARSALQGELKALFARKKKD